MHPLVVVCIIWFFDKELADRNKIKLVNINVNMFHANVIPNDMMKQKTFELKGLCVGQAEVEALCIIGNFVMIIGETRNGQLGGIIVVRDIP